MNDLFYFSPVKCRILKLALLMLACLVVPVSETQASEPQSMPGLAMHYYGNRSFYYHGGYVSLESLDISKNLGRVHWPKESWKAGKVFHRNTGWSVAVYGSLRVPKSGAYRFFYQGNEAQLWLNGICTALDGSEAIDLKAGQVPIRLYIKSDTSSRDWKLNLHLRWQGATESASRNIDASLLTHHPVDVQHVKVYNPDIALTEKNAMIRFWHRRDYEIDLPQGGFYEIAAHLPASPRKIEMSLDGKFLYHHQFRTSFDPGGPSDYRFGFLNTAGAVRYLAKGKHVLTLAGYDGTYPFTTKGVNTFFKEAYFGVSLISPQDAISSLTVYAKDRRDMVFRKNEPLVVRIEQATLARQTPATYHMQVVRQRGDGKIIWQSQINLPLGQSHAIGEIQYPCSEEGAFEYTVTDAKGKIIDGPWALVVIDTTPQAIARASAPVAAVRKILVDSVDCTQDKDPAHKFRSNGTSRVVQGVAGAYRVTGRSYKERRAYKTNGSRPGVTLAKKGERGNTHYDAMDWFAYTLKVKHPQKPHMVVAYVPNDVQRLVSVWGYDQVTGYYSAAVLEAGDAPQSQAFTPLTFLMWPNGDAVDILTFCDSNRSHAEKFWRQGAIAKIELYELPDGLGSLSTPAKGFATGKEFGWQGEQVNLGMEQAMMPSLWRGSDKIPGVVNMNQWCEGPYYDWRALASVWDRFGQLSRWRGDNLLIWPVNSYSMGRTAELAYMERDFESYTRSYRSRIVDPMRRDQLKMMLLECEKYGVQFVADFQMSRWYDFVLLATDTQKKYTTDGLFMTDAQGGVVNYPARILNPAHPLARQYLLGWVAEIAKQYGSYPAFQGINIRQNGWHTNNSGYFYNRNWGYDDFTVHLFEKETGLNVSAPKTGPKRFQKRREILLGKLKQAWFKWRSDKVTSLRKKMLATLRTYAPQARLYGRANTELLDWESGSGLDPKKLAGNRDLGYGQVTRIVGPHVENSRLDPIVFSNFDIRQPKSLRRTLDTALGNRGHEYGSNPCAGAGATIRPHPYQLEPLAKALAQKPLQTVLYGGPWILPPLDQGIRTWAQAWQAIPDLKYKRFANASEINQPIVAWYAKQNNNLVLYLVNITPYPQQVTLHFAGQKVSIENLVDGKIISKKNSATLTVTPYMVRPLISQGATQIQSIVAITRKEQLAELLKQIQFLQSIAPKAKGIIRTLAGEGKPYVKITVGQEQYDDGPWGKRDIKVRFDDLIQPMVDAWNNKDFTTAQALLDTFQMKHSWWYQVFGWPEGIYRPELPDKPYATPRTLATVLYTDGGPISIVSCLGVKGDALVIPKGSATMKVKVDSTGRWALRLWMLAGKGYGPVAIKVDGQSVGQMGTGKGKPYFAHFTLPRPLSLMAGFHAIELVSHGNLGLVLTAAELKQAAPQPIKKWSTIGLFEGRLHNQQKDWEDYNTVFPPERKIDLKASYKGLDGKTITWKQIDIGEDKFIQLLEKYYPYEFSQGNGVAYLATWVYSPDNREATLYYAIDWFGKAWINNHVVLGKIHGPWRSFAQTTVSLHQGWNQLLVKTSCGRSSWKANFAFSDPGDLKYRPTPPSSNNP